MPEYRIVITGFPTLELAEMSASMLAVSLAPPLSVFVVTKLDEEGKDAGDVPNIIS